MLILTKGFNRFSRISFCHQEAASEQIKIKVILLNISRIGQKAIAYC